MDMAQAAGSNEFSTGQKASTPEVIAAVVRVLDLPPSAPVRDDTPLAGVGVDSLALLCIGDVMMEAGWAWDEAAARSATTVGQLSAACRRDGREVVR